MQVTAELDDELMKKAKKLSGKKDHEELLQMLLKKYVASENWRGMFDLVGKVHLRDDYDYKALRVGDSDDAD